MNSLSQALDEHRSKLVGLTEQTARDAADNGGRLVVVAAASRTFESEEAELLFHDGQKKIWGCESSSEWLINWLTDSDVFAICADELPDVRIAGSVD